MNPTLGISGGPLNADYRAIKELVDKRLPEGKKLSPKQTVYKNNEGVPQFKVVFNTDKADPMNGEIMSCTIYENNGGVFTYDVNETQGNSGYVNDSDCLYRMTNEVSGVEIVLGEEDCQGI